MEVRVMNWQQLFRGQILERGLDYYHHELVRDISIQEGIFYTVWTIRSLSKRSM